MKRKNLSGLFTKLKNLCGDPLFWILFVLGFASGLPLGLAGATLQAWYTVEGVDLVSISCLALVGQPYVYKFLWAPVMDRYQPFALGKRRSWLLLTQSGIMLLLVLMAFVQPGKQPLLMALLALVLAFFSASQDVVVDAYRAERLLADQRAYGVGMHVAGYRVAMLVSGGLALVWAQYLGFKSTFLLMALSMSIGMVATCLAEEPAHLPEHRQQQYIVPFLELLNRKNAKILLGCIILYKLGDAFASTLTTSFLLRGLNFTLAEVGLINKTAGLAGTLVGIFCAGYWLKRMNILNALLIFGLIQAGSNLVYIALLFKSSYFLMIIAVFIENFGGGLGTAAFLSFLMGVCDKRYTATQFALFSALAAIGRVFIGPVAGIIAERWGWSDFFIISLFFSIPGLMLVWRLKNVDAESAFASGSAS